MSLNHLRENPEAASLLWNAFLSAYTITGERGARGKDPKRYVVPFHPEIAKALKPKESRPFGRWYIMLMSSNNPPIFNKALHDKFVTKLKDMHPSNLLEKIAIEAAEGVGFEVVSEIDTTPVRPYVEQLSLRFQDDLSSWIENDNEAPSRWLQGVSDLLCFYMMMSIVQFAKNAHQEFDAARKSKDYRAELIPLYFGEWDESASKNRDFSRSWDGRNGLEREIFDSWGRLVALRTISEAMKSGGWTGNTMTLCEAITASDATLQARAVEDVRAGIEHFGHSPRSATLAEMASELANEVSNYYMGKQPSLQSPVTMGINVVVQLGSGSSRQYIRKQNRVGTTLRLNTPAIIFFAKLFNMQNDLSGSFDAFVRFLQVRGIGLDDESQLAIRDRLEALGMLEIQSDSGESIYVRAL